MGRDRWRRRSRSSGCGSSDSTVSKTPEPTGQPASSAPPAPAPTVAAGPTATRRARRSVRGEPRRTRDRQGRVRPAARSAQQPALEPRAAGGNYNECAPLSVVIVKANTNADNPNTRAVMFHLGKFIPTGVPDTYGFNGIDETATTGDTVALMYASDIHRAGERGAIPLERQRGRAHRQHGLARLPTLTGCVGALTYSGERVLGRRRSRPGGDIRRRSRPGGDIRRRSRPGGDIRRRSRRLRHLQRIRPRRRRPVRVRAAALVRRKARPGPRGRRRTTNCWPAPPNSAVSTNNATSTNCAPRQATTWPSSAGRVTPSPGLTAAADATRNAVDRRVPAIYQAAMFDGRFVGFADFLVLEHTGMATGTGCGTPSWPARSRSRRCCSSRRTPTRWPPTGCRWPTRSSWCSATARWRATGSTNCCLSTGRGGPRWSGCWTAISPAAPPCRGRTPRCGHASAAPSARSRCARTTTCCWSRACG